MTREIAIKSIKDTRFAKNIYSLITASYRKELIEFTIYETVDCISIIESSIKFGEFYCLFFNGEIVGFIQVKSLDDCLFLNHIVVAENYKGCGYGENLLGFYESLVRASGGVARLTVDSRNARALSWYIDSGYKELSRNFNFEFIGPADSNWSEVIEIDSSELDRTIGYADFIINGISFKLGLPSSLSAVLYLDKLPFNLIPKLKSAIRNRKLLCQTAKIDYVEGKKSWDTILLEKFID
ncbi:GNAT family N-acetyltransferase [Pseudoalteromonas sp. XMcav11-Q]|uniref:GNAT family N-acetyltransferase n=1 Tax=Pseudoalteromonas sp. XMcav11-Q TaxID=3136665 RepID=UPI0032C3E738